MNFSSGKTPAWAVRVTPPDRPIPATRVERKLGFACDTTSDFACNERNRLTPTIRQAEPIDIHVQRLRQQSMSCISRRIATNGHGVLPHQLLDIGGERVQIL